MTRFIQIAFYFLCLSAFTANAADYPSKTIKLVVPVAPGGPNDIFARTLAPKLSLSLGQPVVIENIAGAGGNQATAMILRLPQDGHTLLLHGLAYAVNPSIFGTSSPYAIEDYVAGFNGWQRPPHFRCPPHTWTQVSARVDCSCQRQA